MLREVLRGSGGVMRLVAAALLATLAGCGSSPDPAPGPNADGPPAISTAPADVNVVAGDAATFTVAATGTGTLAYQWLRDGSAIAGATAASYTLASAALGDDGAHFAVRVSNATGGVDSTAARLGVRSPITGGPASVNVATGNTATFTVVAEGHALSYQWQRDGADIAGAVAASYTTPALSLADSGASFRVRVTNGSVSVLSGAAALTVDTSVANGVRPLRLAAGIGYSMAVRADGRVLIWGTANGLATSPAAVGGTPVAGSAARVVTGLAGIAQVVADTANLADDALAVDGGGQVWRWGWGDTPLAPILASPTAFAALSPAVAFARCTPYLPKKVNLVLRADGTVWVDGTGAVAGLDHVVSLSETGTGSNLAGCTPYAVKNDASVWAIHVNAARNGVDSVVAVAGLPAATQVSCGGDNLGGGYCLVRAADGSVWAWGSNDLGQLGDGTTTGRTIPFQVPGLSGITRVLAGTIATSMAVSGSGVLYTWGGGSGRAAPEDARVPGALGGWTDVKDMAAGFGFALAKRADGSVWGWGTNSSGELGDGTTAQRNTPVRAVGINLN